MEGVEDAYTLLLVGDAGGGRSGGRRRGPVRSAGGAWWGFGRHFHERDSGGAGKVGRTATGGAPVSEESGDGLTGSPRPGQPGERPRAGRCSGGGWGERRGRD